MTFHFDKLRLIKALIFIAALLPLAALVAGALTNGLGANPIETLIRTLGDWALRFLLLTLTITPLRGLTGWRPLVQLRRMLGLYAFFYLCLHLSTYLVLDQFFAWGAILEDILKRPYITIGMLGFTLLLPLALTSNQWSMRRLGSRWKKLHRLIYPAAIGAVLHFAMMVKADLREPLIYALLLALLLGYRLWVAARAKGPALYNTLEKR